MGGMEEGAGGVGRTGGERRCAGDAGRVLWRGVNVHHLELFYYVAKHGGISAAVRRIPYGIQQPAVSGQMGKLEEEVGTKLFERSPFRLTVAGQKLFAHVQPFFENLGSVTAQLREATTPELRLAGAELILRDHLPGVLAVPSAIVAVEDAVATVPVTVPTPDRFTPPPKL